MRKFWGLILSLLGTSASAVPTPIDLGKPNAYEQLTVRFLALREGQSFEGVRQVNNYVFMRNWAFRRKVESGLPGQQILIFFNGYDEKAIAWVEPNSMPLAVPVAPSGTEPALDLAIDLNGEEYTMNAITADGKIYMFRFKPLDW